MPTQEFKDFLFKIAHLDKLIILTSANIQDAVYESFSSIENNDKLIICSAKGIENVPVKTMLALGSNFSDDEVGEFLKG